MVPAVGFHLALSFGSTKDTRLLTVPHSKLALNNASGYPAERLAFSVKRSAVGGASFSISESYSPHHLDNHNNMKIKATSPSLGVIRICPYGGGTFEFSPVPLVFTVNWQLTLTTST
jgi:hypothetical protein